MKYLKKTKGFITIPKKWKGTEQKNRNEAGVEI
jgi:hypothetical protein